MEQIKEQFDKVIEYSQVGIGMPKTDWLFENWEKNKKYIKEAFGNQLIYEVPEKISFELSDEAKNDRIQSFINSMWDLGYDEFARFLGVQKEGFYKNSVVEEYKLSDTNTGNYDKDAIQTALTNLFQFRQR